MKLMIYFRLTYERLENNRLTPSRCATQGQTSLDRGLIASLRAL